MHLEEAIYFINLHRGFQTMPQWLVNQIPLELDPNLQQALDFLAQRVAKRFFPDDLKLNPLNSLPYFLPPEEAQLTEIYLSGIFGPLRNKDFQNQLLLRFLYPTTQTQLSLFLSPYLERAYQEMAWQMVAQNPEQQYQTTLLDKNFILHKLQEQSSLNGQELLSLLYSATALNDLPLTQSLWEDYDKYLSTQYGQNLQEISGPIGLGYTLPEFRRLKSANPLSTAILGQGDRKLIEYLLRHHCPFNINEDEEIIQALGLRGEPQLLEAVYSFQKPRLPLDFESPYIFPLCRNDLQYIRALARLGFPLNSQNDPSQPLFIAIARKLDPAANLLLELGASLSHAFYQGFCGGDNLLDDANFQADLDMSVLRSFLSECREKLLVPGSPLAQHYAALDIPFTRALERVYQNEGDSFFGTVETVIWALECFEDLSRQGQHLQLKNRKEQFTLAEKLVIDLNHLILLALENHGYPELIKKTLIELGRLNEFVILPWPKLIPLCLQFETLEPFKEILNKSNHFFRFKDGFYHPEELQSNWLLYTLAEQSPAVFFIAHQRLDLLSLLLDKQPDLLYWQTLYGDSLLSLAMLENNLDLIKLLAGKGFSLTQALKTAIGEDNLLLTDYLLHWILRKLKDNHKSYYQSLLSNGLDLGETLNLAKGRANGTIFNLFKKWLALFPENLKLFSLSHPEALELTLNPIEAEVAILQELRNPNHQRDRHDPIEEREYLTPDLTLQRGIELGLIVGEDFFTPLHTLPESRSIPKREREQEVLALISRIKKRDLALAQRCSVEGPQGQSFSKVHSYLPHPDGSRALIFLQSRLLLLVDLVHQTTVPLFHQSEQEAPYPFYFRWAQGNRKILYGPTQGKMILANLKKPNEFQGFSS